MAPTSPNVVAIGTELHQVAQRLVTRVFLPAGSKAALPIPKLRELIARAFPREWQEDRAAALELLLSTAISRLDGEFGDITRSEAALRLFNLDGTPTFPDVKPVEMGHLDGKKYVHVVQSLRVHANLHESQSNFTRRIEDLRLQLAAVLADSRFLAVPNEPGEGWITDPGIVTRDSDLAWLETAYQELLQGGGFMQIWGISGVGKTVLARQFAQHIADTSPVGFIRCGRRGLIEEDIRHVLELEGHHIGTWTDEQCHAIFRRAIQNLKVVRLVVLDGVRNHGDITALVPGGVNIPVLVTTPERLSFPEPPIEQYRNIRSHRVMTFSFEQSAELLNAQLDSLSPELIKRLSLAVGGHPESLAHVCSLLKRDDTVSPDELLTELSLQTRGTLADIAQVMDVPQSAATVIQNLFQRLDTGSLAHAILISLVWSSDFGQQPRDLILELINCTFGWKPSVLAVRAALNELDRMGLAGATPTAIRTSRLAALVIRELTPKLCEPVLLAFEKLIQQEPSGHHWSSNLIEVLRHDYSALASLRPLLAERFGNTNEPLPVLFPLDEARWALYVTHRGGVRQAAAYRVLPDRIQVLYPGRSDWEPVTGDYLKTLADMTSAVRELLVSNKLARATLAQRRGLQQVIEQLNETKPEYLKNLDEGR